MAKEQKVREETANTIYYELLGEGKQTILLVNGLARSSRHWLNFKDELLSRGYQLLVVDNRGFGKSKHLKMPLNASIDLFAKDILHVMDLCQIVKVHAVGLSLGGMIVLHLAGQYPERVSSMTVVNSSAAKTHPMRMSPNGLGKLLKMGMKKTPELRTKIELTALTSLNPDDERYAEIFDAFVTLEKEEPVNPKNVVLQLGAAVRFSLQDIKAAISQPLTIVYSNKDQFVPNQNSLGLQKNIPHAVLHCIDGAGHELMVEEPKALADLISRQLAMKDK